MAAAKNCFYRKSVPFHFAAYVRYDHTCLCTYENDMLK